MDIDDRDHEWVEVTTLEDPGRVYLCVIQGCGAERFEPYTHTD